MTVSPGKHRPRRPLSDRPGAGSRLHPLLLDCHGSGIVLRRRREDTYTAIGTTIALAMNTAMISGILRGPDTLMRRPIPQRDSTRDRIPFESTGAGGIADRGGNGRRIRFSQGRRDCRTRSRPGQIWTSDLPIISRALPSDSGLGRKSAPGG